MSYGHEDELASVGAIYYNEVSVEPPNRAILSCDKDLRIAFILPDDYPDKYLLQKHAIIACIDQMKVFRSPPELEISAPSLSAAGKHRIHAALQRVFKEHPGEPVLYYAIDAALQMQRDPTTFDDENDIPGKASGSGAWTEEDQKALEDEERRRREEKKANVVYVPETYSGESVEDRKSVFQAHVARIKSKEEVSAHFSLRENLLFLGDGSTREAQGEQQDRPRNAQHVRVGHDDREERQELRAPRLRGTNGLNVNEIFVE